MKETDDEIRASQQIYYPTVKPDTKNPLRIQPGNDEVYIPQGCVTPVTAQPVRAYKAKGLLERLVVLFSLKDISRFTHAMLKGQENICKLHKVKSD